ncbi:MAG: D-aminoacylase [archaeon GB-1867-005]|nr:D-aminoacylase [Candidatus Culexmicrobium cathedralense]
MDEFDILIENAMIVDGTGMQRFAGYIGVKDEKLAYLSVEKPGVDAKHVIDAKGLIACPGFVDIHGHADETIILYPKAENYVLQGVTTVVGGNCGFSPAPVGDYWLMSFWELDWWHELKPFKYYPPLMHPVEKVNEKLKEKFGFTIDWRTFGEYLDKVESKGMSINLVPIVGHNAIRAAVMGEDFKRKAKPEEIEKMKEHVREAMEAGAHGLSSGLDYAPGFYADTQELIELVKVVKEYNGIYATHWRRTGIRTETRREVNPPEKIKGIIEAIEIGRKTGVPVQVSHILTGYVIYPPPPPELLEAAAKATLKVIEDARKDGVDIAFDLIPNTTGGVFSVPRLIALLTPWLREAGSEEKLIENLKAEDYRREVKEAIYAGKWYSVNPIINPYWMNGIVIRKCKNEEYVGKTLGEIAKIKNADPVDTLIDLIIEDPGTLIEPKIVDEREVVTYVKHPLAMIGIDTFALDFKWEAKVPPYYLPHPNTYGAYPRCIRRFVKELKVLTLEEAIKKATYMPAQRMKLKDRGAIKVGYYADILLFDYNSISEGGDYLTPRKPPKGIKYVIINGKIVVENGKHTGAKPGKLLRKKGKS